MKNLSQLFLVYGLAALLAGSAFGQVGLRIREEHKEMLFQDPISSLSIYPKDMNDLGDVVEKGGGRRGGKSSEFGGGSDGGGNIGSTGKVFDFQEYEDLEEIEDLTALPILKNPNGIFARLRAFLKEHYNEAFLDFFLKSWMSKKWYFDNSDAGYDGACINVSLSNGQRTSVACQDENEVRINKKWFHSKDVSELNKVGIIMHELLLKRALRNVTPEYKIMRERAVRAINAHLFAMLMAPNEKSLRLAKQKFEAVVLTRDGSFHSYGNPGRFVAILFHPDRLRSALQDYQQAMRVYLSESLLKNEVALLPLVAASRAFEEKYGKLMSSVFMWGLMLDRLNPPVFTKPGLVLNFPGFLSDSGQKRLPDYYKYIADSCFPPKSPSPYAIREPAPTIDIGFNLQNVSQNLLSFQEISAKITYKKDSSSEEVPCDPAKRQEIGRAFAEGRAPQIDIEQTMKDFRATVENLIAF